MREDILNYEKRLLEDRQKLLELSRECGSDNSALTRDKLNYFNTELIYMNNQLNMLKAELAKGQSAQVAARPVHQPQMTSQAGASVSQTPNVQSSAGAERPEPQTHNIPPVQPVQNKAEPAPSTVRGMGKKHDLEKTVGKSLMGIFASVLIFISLILFATLLLPYVTDTAKMIITYIISFGFIGFGLVKLKKDKSNKFCLSLTGCGVGALYVSILLTNFYFKAVGDITLYIMIALWAVFVCWLSRLKNSIFQIIGYAGILISMIFGSVLCVNNNDAVKFLVLIIFYAVTGTIFYIAHFSREFSKNIIHHIFNVLNLSAICISCYEFLNFHMAGKAEYLPAVAAFILILVHIVIVFCNNWKNTKFSIGIVLSVYAVMLINMFSLFVHHTFVNCFTVYIISMAISVLAEYKKSDFVYDKRIVQAVMLLFAFICTHNSAFQSVSFCIPLVILPVLVLGFFRGNSVYKYGSLALLLIYIVVEDAGYIEQMLCALLTLCVEYFMVYKFKEKYSHMFNITLHIVSLLYILLSVSDGLFALAHTSDISYALTFVIIAVFNVVMMKSVFAKNLITGQYEKGIVYRIINTVNMIAGLVLIESTENIVLHMLVILVSLAIFMLNTKNLLDKYKNILVGFYVGLKLTVLVVVILNSFDAANYIISTACFIFAIAAIIIGFKAEYKSLRIYGLILSMLSIFKLVMVDIHYANTLGNAVSFFVSGILCFAISMIYNYIDKKLVSKTRDDIGIN